MGRMGRSKNSKQPPIAFGKGSGRKETKEERRKRLAASLEAKEQCLRLLVPILGVLVLLIILFVLYIRSIPPLVRGKTTDPIRLQPEVPTSFPDIQPEIVEDGDQIIDL